MIRILHVVGKMHRAGQETAIMTIYRKLDRERVQFDFLVHTLEKCDYDDEILALGGRFFRTQKITRGILRYILSVRKIVRDNKFDIVHLSTAHSAGFFVLLAAKLGGARVRIAHSHNDNYDHPLLHKALMPLICKYSTHRLACSANAGRWMFGKRDFVVMYNAIDVNAYKFNPETRARARAELGLTDEFVIGHIGRFAKQKNHGFLLRALAAYKRRNPNFIALLIGDGELLDDMKTLAKRLDIEENLRFLGVREDVPALLAAMDLFAFPSLYEGFGIVLVEAQASGLPVLASDQIARDAAVTDLVRFLSIGTQTDVWVDGIVNSQRYERARYAQKIAKAGFDVDIMAQRYMDFYLDVARRCNADNIP